MPRPNRRAARLLSARLAQVALRRLPVAGLGRAGAGPGRAAAKRLARSAPSSMQASLADLLASHGFARLVCLPRLSRKRLKFTRLSRSYGSGPGPRHLRHCKLQVHSPLPSPGQQLDFPVTRLTRPDFTHLARAAAWLHHVTTSPAPASWPLGPGFTRLARTAVKLSSHSPLLYKAALASPEQQPGFRVTQPPSRTVTVTVTVARAGFTRRLARAAQASMASGYSITLPQTVPSSLVDSMF